MADERDQFIKRILAAEATFPVDIWKVGNIHVWPVIRIRLFFSWFNAWKRSSGGDRAGMPAEPADAVATTAKSSYLKFVTNGLLSWFRLKKLNIPVTRFLFSGAYTHRIAFKGTFYNRYFDPFISELDEGILLEYQRKKRRDEGGKTRPGYAHPEKVYELEEYLPWFRLKHALAAVFTGRKQSIELPGYERFLEQFKDVNTRELLPDNLCGITRQLEEHASMYAYFIKKTKASYLFGLCYYSIPMYGMNLAAKRCGGISVDMQHGTQGSMHIAYANWRRLPPDGYELLPNWFWVWDQGSHDVIARWSAPSGRSPRPAHQVFQGGNPALQLNDPDYALQAFHGKPVILYTLQPLGQVIEPFIIDTIKRTSTSYTWWLRFHPRHKETEKAEIRGRLQSHGLLGEVNLKEANQLPLPVILHNTAVHLSRFSGSIIEGVQLGVPSIVIDETGAATFADLLRSGVLTACVDENAATLAALIRKLSDESDREGGNQDRGRKAGSGVTATASSAWSMEQFIKKASLRK